MMSVRSRLALAGLPLAIITTPVLAQPAVAGDWSKVENTLGRRGTAQPGDVMRFSFPRRDLRVIVQGVAIRPSLALGSWVAFKRVGSGHAMVMGDLVLLDAEVNDVIPETFAKGRWRFRHPWASAP